MGFPCVTGQVQVHFVRLRAIDLTQLMRFKCWKFNIKYFLRKSTNKNSNFKINIFYFKRREGERRLVPNKSRSGKGMDPNVLEFVLIRREVACVPCHMLSTWYAFLSISYGFFFFFLNYQQLMGIGREAKIISVKMDRHMNNRGPSEAIV